MTTLIETERLILREIDIDADLDRWVEMMSDEDTVRYIGGKTLDRAQCWRQMTMLLGHQQVRGFGFLSVIEKASGQFIGRVGPWFPEGWPEPEIGWTIMKSHARQGFAKEAGAACLDYVFETLGWERCIHAIDVNNVGSIRTAESLGSQFLYKIEELGGFPGADCDAYGQTREDWHAFRKTLR